MKKQLGTIWFLCVVTIVSTAGVVQSLVAQTSDKQSSPLDSFVPSPSAADARISADQGESSQPGRIRIPQLGNPRQTQIVGEILGLDGNASELVGKVRTPIRSNEPTPLVNLPQVDESENASSDDEPMFLRDDQSTPLINRDDASEPRMLDRAEFDPAVEDDHPKGDYGGLEQFLYALEQPVHPLAHFIECLTCAEHYQPKSFLDEVPIGIQETYNRPNLFVESNEGFLAAGELSEGIEMPTGAIWRPSLWVFGTYRIAGSYLDRDGGTTFAEVAHRLDLFTQLNLTGTERVLLGLRTFDKERSSRRRFTSYDFRDGRFVDGVNADIQTLFFEGDLGEIFPDSDGDDVEQLDVGFSVGRQPMLFQQGLLINEDMLDALTVTRNTGSGEGNLNMRVTTVYAWNEINRNNGMRDQNAQLFGLFTESDFETSTVNADFAYVSSESSLGSLMAFGLSAIQRLQGSKNIYNTSFHVLGSYPTEGETVASGKGVLLFAQGSWTPHHTNDLVYLNGFWAIDQFTSPSRGPLMGGPLGQTGILFAAPGLGQFGAPLSNQANKAAGASLGYQMFFDESRQQVVVELGGRKSTDGRADGAIGLGTRYQKALGQHWILVLDGFATMREGQRVVPGTRLEFLAKF